MKKLLLIVIFAVGAQAGRLPSYITQCKKSDPELEACVVRAANLAIPLLAKGDYHYDIPNMLPLKLSHAVLKFNKDLKFILYDVEVHGLQTANVTHAKMDLEEGLAEYTFNIPSLVILAKNYDLRGNLLNISVYGSGLANITLVDGEYKYDPRFKPRSDKSETRYKIEDYALDYETKRTIYKLENLYNGELFSSYELGLYLNQHWKDVAKVLRPSARKIMGNFIALILSNLADIVSTDEYFKEK